MSRADENRILVLGGGIVGCVAALGLANNGYAVTLVDRQEPKITRGRFDVDIRHVALSPASQQMLAKFGAWDSFVSAPYRCMHVWEQWGMGQLDFTAAEVGRQELGWLVEVSPLLCKLWQQLHSQQNIDVRLGEISRADFGALSSKVVSIAFADGNEAQYNFVVAADGAQSFVRRVLNVSVDETQVNQVALATVVKTQKPHQHTAWQRFGTDGPLALLPAQDEHTVSVVWSQSPNKARLRQRMSEAEFCADITHASEHCLGDIIAVDQRLCFPLIQQSVKSCLPHPRALLIGDAMRVVHPLAGLGVNVGIEDVRGLLGVANHGLDLATPGIWQRFVRQRAARSASMIRMLELLQKTYGNPNPGVTLLRNMGIQAFNALHGIKQQVMREAMGLGPIAQGN